jgi:uncharacterized RDD family membrane protein YckC
MTQQFEHGAQPATAPGPVAEPPSPYPQPGQTPEAYPAPPQPGRPGFGTAQGLGRRPPAYGARPAAAQADQALAERWRRFVGWLLDTVIISVLASPLFLPAATKLVRRFEQILRQYPNGATPAAQAAMSNAIHSMVNSLSLAALAVVAISFVYYWLQTAFWGRTIGKRAVGILVVNAADRSNVGLVAAAVRAGVYVLLQAAPTIGVFLFLADNGWLLFDPARQCLHDKAARTVVVKKAYLQARR